MTKNQLTILSTLEKMYPEVECALDYGDHFQLAVAVILSAQCTDKRVNMVTPHLFARCPTIDDYIDIPRNELEQLIFSTGFYQNKAKSIQLLAYRIKHEYGGELPKTIEELIKLPGIGRKTANVVLGEAYGIVEGVVVDTHVSRNSYRLGFASDTENAVKKERELMKVLPKKSWYSFSHRLILLGRGVCEARKPKCSQCEMLTICPRNGVKNAQ